MSCAISPFLMAQQWRRPFCAIIKFALGNTNGALVCAVWYFQWRANSANGAKKKYTLRQAPPWAALIPRPRTGQPANFFRHQKLAVNSRCRRSTKISRKSVLAASARRQYTPVDFYIYLFLLHFFAVYRIVPNTLPISGEKMPIDTAQLEPTSPATPPQKSTGKMRLLSLDRLDGRTIACRRARELVSSLQADLGGSDHLSEGTRQLVRRAAVLGVFIENSEAAWLAGQEVALGDYLSAVNSQRRVLTTIGLERRQRDVTPDLDTYLAAAAADTDTADSGAA